MGDLMKPVGICYVLSVELYSREADLYRDLEGYIFQSEEIHLGKERSHYTAQIRSSMWVGNFVHFLCFLSPLPAVLISLPPSLLEMGAHQAEYHASGAPDTPGHTCFPPPAPLPRAAAETMPIDACGHL